MTRDLRPAFLGIGAQRSGSTWLHENLNAHPDIWLPPSKELHYFDELRVEPFFCGRYRKKLRYRLGSVKRSLLRGEFPAADLRWDLRFFLLPRSDRWYVSLFSHGRGSVPGEITPAYSTLPADVVRSIQQLNPQLKVIFLMRDPIDRSWSQARKELPALYGRPLEEIPSRVVLRWFSEPACALRSDYLRTYETWRAFFPEEQIFLGTLDEIIVDPRGFLLRVFEFLQVDASETHISPSAAAVVNARKQVPMAPQYEYELAKIHLPKLARLKEVFDTYPELWHQRCAEVLAREAEHPATTSAGARARG